MNDDLTAAIENLLEMASSKWLSSTCKALRSFPPTATAEFVLQRLAAKMPRAIPASLAKQPAINLQVVGRNEEDILLALGNVMRMSLPLMSWESLSWTLETSAALRRRWHKTHTKAEGRQVKSV